MKNEYKTKGFDKRQTLMDVLMNTRLFELVFVTGDVEYEGNPLNFVYVPQTGMSDREFHKKSRELRKLLEKIIDTDYCGCMRAEFERSDEGVYHSKLIRGSCEWDNLSIEVLTKLSSAVKEYCFKKGLTETYCYEKDKA